MSYIGANPTTAAFLTDQFSGNGSTTAFTLSAAPANTNSILVAISGVLQDPTTYSVTGTTLTFSPAPPAGTGNISVRFLGIPASGVVTTAYRTQTEFTATAGQTTFTPPSYTVGFIDVYRNGVLLGSADFTATNGTTVVLTNPATAGDLIETISFSVSSVLNAIPATTGAVNSTYLLDGAVTQSKLAANVVGNGPTFGAYQNSSQTLTTGTFTKLQIDTEEFDTANCFNTGNYRFTPNVAGYYQVNATYNLNASGVTLATIFKNGSSFKYGPNSTGSNPYGGSVSCLMYMNGTTDYIEFYGYTNGTGYAVSTGVLNTWFNACLVRAA
jgi:hypothetical protein